MTSVPSKPLVLTATASTEEPLTQLVRQHIGEPLGSRDEQRKTGRNPLPTKQLIALALSVAARCDPCIGFHAKALVKMGATRQEIDETLGVTTYMGGGPSLMYAARAGAAFDEFAAAAAPKTA